MSFPTSATNGQTAIVNGITYTYASATNSWTRSPATGSLFSVITDTFTGDGSRTSFTLSVTPGSTDYVVVNIDGVIQQKSAYTLNSNIITFTGTPILGATIEVRTTTGTNVGVITGVVYDSFTGDGNTVSFTLSTTPTNKNYTLVTVGGITQVKSNYNISNNIITFLTAPPNSAPIEVVTLGPASTSMTTIITDNSTPHPFFFMA